MLLQIKSVYLTIKKDAIWNEEDFNLWRCRFIGSHLCERLLDEGNDVICIDNYFTGHKSNIRHLLKHPNFEVIRHDIIYPYMAEVEEIYNLACPASPIYYQHDPVKTTQTSVIGAMNMLGMARYNRAKVLQASTSEVYGDRWYIRRPRITGDT